MIRISLRLPEQLHQQLVERASADRRSLNSEILYLLETVLDDAAEETPAPRPGGPDSSPA
ncbi:Arc family DNA-binding protein [Spirillospora sp. NPDC048819]|uniref:Arc family DNA-binding protein n=1 Tax=Spirillospora sp. NPDC048819 TaxID=3155268 RepID=UPI00340F4623